MTTKFDVVYNIFVFNLPHTVAFSSALEVCANLVIVNYTLSYSLNSIMY